ncbi:ribonuclease R [Barnesiella intestinihominis]|uniref:ribonuclease R n=1 Tax=Barnesiella intestinihominis TaxID=487174 RepID=UPI003AB2F453
MMKQGKRKGSKRIKKEDMLASVVEFFNQDRKRAFNYKQVAHGVGATTTPQKQMVFQLLEGMAEQNFLIEVSPGKYKANSRGTEVIGRFERRVNGKNHVITDDDESIFIAERNAMHAMDGDRVRVLVYAKRRGHDAEGEVVEIVEKTPQIFVGTLEVQKHFAFLLTDNKVLANDIFIPKTALKGGKTGDKAVVRITEWPDRARNPYGEVVDILGPAGENNTEIHAILAEFGLPYRYPEAVEKAANKIPDEITDEEIAAREDFRQVTTFTIDPKDAKDFDDALSIRRLSNGNWEVGVHIADVSYYVKPGSIIDKEAESRGTSVYLVDRVVPMLPERLCNEICSLRPDEDKLTFSCVFELNGNAEVQKSHIARTVIRSNRRFAYEEAQEVIETGEGDYKEEILALNDLAQKLRKRRFDNGSINFDRHEVKFDIDESGKPIGVYFKVSKEANKLIEEFMLLANRTVAEFIGKPRDGKKPKAFVYRVHDLPDPDKMASFAAFITRFGYKIKTEGSKADLSKGINSLLANVQGKPEENLVETIAIRAMAKAVYTTVNIGHYGLSFDYYTHFTSPIRRYPDLMVHRLLERYMAGGRSVNVQSLEDECKHASDMEQLAANAERASIKYKQVEFMGERLGEEYDGVISGITEWGLYVEINENKCEGLVPIRDLEDDYYEFDEKNYCLMGRRKHRIYRLGDPIRIKVARANLERKQLDFALVE